MTDEQIFDEARPLSIMGPKLLPLIQAARSCVDVPGDVVEVGVYRGGSGLALCRVFNEKKVFLIDTFTGIPEDDALPGGHKKGDFGDTDCNTVFDMLNEKGALNGLPFQGDIRSLKIQTLLFDRPLAFVHLDADIEQSTMAAVEFLVVRLSPGGGIFFDDYTNERCPAIRQIVELLMVAGRFDMTLNHGTAFLKLK